MADSPNEVGPLPCGSSDAPNGSSGALGSTENPDKSAPIVWFDVCRRPIVRLRLSTFAIAALLLAGCASRAKGPATPAAEPDYDWGQFKGNGASADAKGDKSAKPEKIEKAEKPETKPAANDAAKADAPKKVSTNKIAGHSLSEVSADEVASASKTATKLKVVSTAVIVGAEYEQINVVLDKMTVQIIRPASSPDSAGPKVRSPKSRNDDAVETDATLYDANADVLVLVRGDKKAISKKALTAIVGGAAAKKKPGRTAKPKRVP